MMFVHIIQFIVIYTLIKFVLSEFIGPEQQTNENSDGENSVLDSVYDTMKHNYEIKLRQNLHKLNLISEIRNKRNVNEPMDSSIIEYYKNHQYEINGKNPVNFLHGLKIPPRVPTMGPVTSVQSRADYGYEEYQEPHVDCHEKPSVQTFHISDHEHGKKDDHGVSALLLLGIKFVLGGIAILALKLIVFKALVFLKFLFVLKIIAVARSFLSWVFFLRVLRFFRFIRRFGLNGFNNGGFLGFSGKHKNKLQTIRDILNSDDAVEEDVEFKSDDVISKRSLGSSQIFNNRFNSTEETEEFVEYLVKLMKQKNKDW